LFGRAEYECGHISSEPCETIPDYAIDTAAHQFSIQVEQTPL